MTAAPPISSFVPGTQSNAEGGVDLEGLLGFVLQLAGGNGEADLVISGGAVTPTRALHRVDTEGAGASDDLDRINTTNLPAGSWLVLRSKDGSRDIRLRAGQGGAGQIFLQNPTAQGSTFTLADPSMAILLAHTAGPSWTEVGRWYGSQNGAMRSYLGLSDGATMPIASTAEVQAATSDGRIITPAKLTTAFNTYEVALGPRDVETNRWLNAWLPIGRSAADAGGVSWLRKISLENLLGASFRSYAESGEIALVAGTSGVVTNALGSQARLVQGILRCKTADRGYDPGNEVNLDSTFNDNNARLVTLASYDGGVSWAIGNNTANMGIVDFATRQTTFINAVNWRLVIRAWR